MTEEEKQQRAQSKAQAAVSFGATMLGAFLGRKAVAAATAIQQQEAKDQSPTPCPFCGAAQLKIKSQPGAYTVFFVECPECQARGPAAPSEEKAKSSWIQRVS